MKTDADFKEIGVTVIERYFVPERLFLNKITNEGFVPLISIFVVDDETGEFLLFFEDEHRIVEREMLLSQWIEIIHFTWEHLWLFDPTTFILKEGVTKDEINI